MCALLKKMLRFVKSAVQGLFMGSDWINRVIGGVGAVLVAVATALTAYDVFMRYVLSRPAMWREDVLALFVVVLAFLTAGYIEREKFHIRIDLVTNAISGRARKIVDVVAGFFSLGVCGLLVYSGLLMANQSWINHEMSSMVVMPMAPIRSALFVGFALWGVVMIRDIYLLFRPPVAKK